MKRHYSAPGDEIASRQPVTVRRYKGYTRLNHWVTAGSLIVLALSAAYIGWFRRPLVWWEKVLLTCGGLLLISTHWGAITVGALMVLGVLFRPVRAPQALA